MEWVIGIDIGGKDCVVGAVAADGARVLGDHAQPTLAARGSDAVIADLVTMSKRVMAQVRGTDPVAEVLGVGAGCPGPLDIKAGLVLITPNLGWENIPLRDR